MIQDRKVTMHVILMGPQGSGKGTQAARLAPRLGLEIIATGELFRSAIKAKTPLGLQVTAVLDRGDLVPDETTVALVEERLDELAERRRLGEAVGGALYDGFPRTQGQAEALSRALAARDEAVTAVVEIAVPTDKLIERLTGRRVCGSCGRVYHVDFNPPRTEGACDICGGALVQRSDDTREAVQKRLDLYFTETAPLLAYYRDQGLVRRVDGDRPIGEVTEALVAVVTQAAGPARRAEPA